MSVKYSVVALRNPRRISEPPKFYAKAQAHGNISLETICENVSHAGSIIRGDVLAVSDGLIFQMIAGCILQDCFHKHHLMPLFL